MIKQEVLDKAAQYFPNAKIAFKDKSILMKIIGVIAFFNPAFMKSYTTTIMNTIYYPSQSYVDIHPVSALVIFLHELTHIYDKNRISGFLFFIAYLFPQILFLLLFPFLFLSWKVALVFLVFLAPIPAYFRMVFEKRAYITSLYVLNKLNQTHNYNVNLDDQCNFFIAQFKGAEYYFAWPLTNIDQQFKTALQDIKNNKRPYEDKIFDILDEIIAVF